MAIEERSSAHRQGGMATQERWSAHSELGVAIGERSSAYLEVGMAMWGAVECTSRVDMTKRGAVECTLEGRDGHRRSGRVHIKRGGGGSTGRSRAASTGGRRIEKERLDPLCSQKHAAGKKRGG